MLLDLVRTSAQTEKLLGVIRLIYEYAYLEGRQAAGLRLSSREVTRLDWLRPFLEAGPTEQRRHRRIRVAIPVLLRSSQGLCRGMLLNVSGSGMFVASDAPLATGDALQLLLGGQTEYSFPCTVQWTSRGAVRGMGLRFCGIPLEIRRGTSHPASADSAA